MLESFHPPAPAPALPPTPDSEHSDGNASFPGNELVTAILRGEAHGWRGRRISGDVSLKGLRVESPVALHGVVFSGVVDFSQARFERGVDLRECTFQQKVILSDAWIGGPLLLDKIVIGTAPGTSRDVARIRLLLDRLKENSRHRRWQERLETELGVREGLLSNQQTALELDNLRVGGCLSLVNASVFGGLSSNHARIESDLRIDGAKIHGELSLRHASLGELRTDAHADLERGPNERCLIEGDLNLASATVTGDVRLIGATIGGELILQAADIHGNALCRSSKRLRSRLGRGAWLVVARVKGNIDLGGTRLHGELNLGTATIGGNLQCSRGGKWHLTLDGAAVMPNARIGADVTFEGCRARGDINLISAKVENEVSLRRTIAQGSIYAQNALIGGNLSLIGAHIEHDLWLQSASIGGNLFLRATSGDPSNARCEICKTAWLPGVTIAGDIDISGIHVGDDLALQNASISQNLIAHTWGGFQSQIYGDAQLNGACIRGNVDFLGLALQGDLDLDGASIDGSLQVAFDLDEEKSWKIVPSRVGGRLHADAATIGKDVVLGGLIIGSEDRDGEEESGVSFVGARISGELALHSAGLAKEILRSQEVPAGTMQEVIGLARQERTVIHGGLRLTRAQVLGGLTMDGIMIEGDLDMRDTTVRANIACRPVPLADGKSKRAVVFRADFETLDMTGDVDLTGLTIRGHLNLRDSRIRGRLELYPFEHESKPTDEMITGIEGKLQLDAAEISHVILSGLSLAEENQAAEERRWWQIAVDVWWVISLLLGRARPEKEKHVRIGLERAKIGRMQIVEPLPGTLDLSNLRVDRWDLPKDPSSYRKMLESSYPFKRSNYLAIESALRNAGEDEQADEVHVWMRRRDCRSTKGPRVWIETFLDLSIKYGTTSKRLLCLMGILFAISVWCFKNPNHVEYKASQVPPQVIHPVDWNLWDAALYATRLHVPIISLGVEEDMQPSGLAMKSYAMAIVAASWVMWPLLLASVSGFIRKRT